MGPLKIKGKTFYFKTIQTTCTGRKSFLYTNRICSYILGLQYNTTLGGTIPLHNTGHSLRL